MPNVSELARIEAEERAALIVELNTHKSRYGNLRYGKQYREASLRHIRRIEKLLGIVAVGNVNSTSAQEQQDEALSGVVTWQDLKDARSRVELLTPGEIGTIIIALGKLDTAIGRALIAKLLNR